jgi:hypothetical protein
MTRTEWIEKYQKKAETFYEDPDFKEIYVPDKGFMCYKFDDDGTLHLGHTCTNDMEYWRKVAYDLARKQGNGRIKTITMRNPAAYIKMTGTHLDLSDSGYRPNGIWYWAMERMAE